MNQQITDLFLKDGEKSFVNFDKYFNVTNRTNY